MSIYDLITSGRLKVYWKEVYDVGEPFIFEEKFPDEQKLGLDIKWLKGSSGAVQVLKLSAYDVEAIPRQRIGFDQYFAEMPFFKESMYIDETLRQELNKILESGNEAYISIIVEKIFKDEMKLIQAARIQRERMRAMLVTTGVISLASNGQRYDYDFGMPEDHKVTVAKSWSDPEADILGDIRAGIEKIQDDTGITVTEAVCSSKVMGYIRKNREIKETLLNLTQGSGNLSDAKILTYFQDEFELKIVKYDKRFKDEKGQMQRFIPEDIFVMMPSGDLGTSNFGTTPEQSDLLSSKVANVSIVDTGVAVTTMEIPDPVTVETKVTMIFMPDLPTADQIYILDVEADAA